MTFEEIKTGVMNLSLKDQQRLIKEVLPEIWPKACTDNSCVKRVRELVDEDAVKRYQEEHLGSI
jgi:hypothetical protein